MTPTMFEESLTKARDKEVTLPRTMVFYYVQLVRDHLVFFYKCDISLVSLYEDDMLPLDL